MFNAPRYVIKSGQLLISNHEFVSDYTDKKVLRVTPEYDENIENLIKPFFADYYSIEFSNYAVPDSFLHNNEVISINKKS